MGKHVRQIRDAAVTVLILAVCFCASLLLQHVFLIPEHITTSFTFAVFLISLLTDGYTFGLAAALAGTLLVNYAFTFPYFALNFIIPSNFFSALILIIISILTSTLTTKVKHQEALRAESEKERLRANLLRAISHDLRTPLTTIYSSSSALLEDRGHLTPQQQERILQGIREDAQWLVRMVENLLSVTRIDGGNVKISMVPTALDELVDSVIVKFRKQYPQQKVLLELPEELVMIPMDAMLIQQVLMNILENAVQHARSLSQIVFRVKAENDMALFEIEDDGCGIEPERLSRLFDGYYESKTPGADSHKRNIGIGLSVCAAIIRVHNSSIHAENRPSGGAVFRFALKTEETADE